MTRFRFLALLLAAVLSLLACTTPPITTPKVQSTVYLRDIVPGMPESRMPLIVPATPVFNLPPAGIDVPENARRVTLASAVLHLDIQNQMKIPLTLKIYLSDKQDGLYSEANLLGDVSLVPEQSGRIDNTVKDPAIFKSEKVYVGIGMSTPGTGTDVASVQGSDAVVVDTSATVQVKLF